MTTIGSLITGSGLGSIGRHFLFWVGTIYITSVREQCTIQKDSFDAFNHLNAIREDNKGVEEMAIEERLVIASTQSWENYGRLEGSLGKGMKLI